MIDIFRSIFLTLSTVALFLLVVLIVIIIVSEIFKFLN